MAIREVGGTTALGGTGEKFWLALCWSVFVLIGASGAAYGENAGERVFSAAFLAVNAVLLVRIIRIQVRAEPDHLVLRGLLRTRRLPWDQVESALVVPTNDFGLFGIVRITDRAGRRVKADGVGNWLPRRDVEGLPVSRMAAVINGRARA